MVSNANTRLFRVSSALRHKQYFELHMVRYFHSADLILTCSSIRAKDGRHILQSDLGGVQNGALLVDSEGRILEVGPTARVSRALQRLTRGKKRVSVQRISLKGRVVLPAFTECHTHLLYAGSRAGEFEQRNTGVSYAQIAARGGGIRSTVASTRLATWTHLEKELKKRLLCLAEQGVTTVEVKTGYFSSVEEELSALKRLVRLRNLIEEGDRDHEVFPEIVVTCLAAHWVPDGETPQGWLRAIEEQIFPYCAKNRVRVDIFVDQGAFTLEQARWFLRSAVDSGLAVTVHADQLTRSGAALLGIDLEAQSVDHLIQLKLESDFSEFAKGTKTVATLLPAADLYTRLPYPNARGLIDGGACVALATDHNPGSSPALDIALVGVLARTQMQMSLSEVIAAYTYGAAKALGLQTSRGVLEPGMQADFVVLNPNESLESLFYQVGTYRGHSTVIDQVYKRGRPLVAKKKLRSSQSR